MTTFTPADDIVGPIITDLVTLGQSIQGITQVLAYLPDGAPEDNTVIFDLGEPFVDTDIGTNVKDELTFHFVLLHLFMRRGRLQDTISTAFSYIHPWLDAMDAWDNQMPGGARALTPRKISIRRVVWGGTQFIGLEIPFDVLTEINILL